MDVWSGLVVLLFVVVVYKVVQWKKYRLPPGPRVLPVVGNLLDIGAVRFRCFWEWSKQYGPIMSVWFGSTLNVIVSNTELAKEVLKEHDQQLANRPRNRSTESFSRNGQDLIWADYGAHYVKVRKVCTLELFSPKRLEALRAVREDEVAAMVESIFKDQGTGKALGIKKYLSVVAFNNVTRIVFGKRLISEEGKMDPQGVELKEIVGTGARHSFTMAFIMAEYIPYLRWMLIFEEGAFAKNCARRDRFSKAIMEEHTLARQKSGAKQHFVDALLTLQETYHLSEDTIIGLLWDMILAGMDTTGVAVEWAMAELVRNPRVQQKVQEELDRVIGKDRVINETDFTNLPYLQCLTKEALRLHPPTPLMLPHKARENVKIGGYDIPKGSNVQVNVWAIARDPAVWKDPLAFRPERFLEEDVDMKGHDYRLLPFGAGRRVCPGAQLAIYLVQSMLAHLLHHFTWTPPQGMNAQDIDLTESPGLVTFMAKPVEAIATPRLPHHLYRRISKV